MASLPENKTEENDDQLPSALLKLTVSNPHESHSNQQLKLQISMQQSAIGNLEFGVLDETKNETEPIRKFKQSRPELQTHVDGLRDAVDGYAKDATTEQSQRSVYNLKAAVMTGISAVNGLMAVAVMDAELASTQVSATYTSAQRLLQQSLYGVVQTSVNTAMYNQEIYGEKDIRNSISR